MKYDFTNVIGHVSALINSKKWSWYKNISCKYINLTIDTRDGSCVIKDRFNNVITLEELKEQHK